MLQILFYLRQGGEESLFYGEIFCLRRIGVLIFFQSKEKRRIGVLFYGEIISPYLLNSLDQKNPYLLYSLDQKNPYLLYSLDQKPFSLALTAGGERWLQTRRKVVPFRQKGGWFLAESDTDTQM